MAPRPVAYKQTGDVISAQLRFASGATGYLNAIRDAALHQLHCLRLRSLGRGPHPSHPDTPGPTTVTVQYADARAESRDYDSGRYR